jgi:hypothetical protein
MMPKLSNRIRHQLFVHILHDLGRDTEQFLEQGRVLRLVGQAGDGGHHRLQDAKFTAGARHPHGQGEGEVGQGFGVLFEPQPDGMGRQFIENLDAEVPKFAHLTFVQGGGVVRYAGHISLFFLDTPEYLQQLLHGLHQHHRGLLFLGPGIRQIFIGLHHVARHLGEGLVKMADIKGRQEHGTQSGWSCEGSEGGPRPYRGLPAALSILPPRTGKAGGGFRLRYTGGIGVRMQDIDEEPEGKAGVTFGSPPACEVAGVIQPRGTHAVHQPLADTRRPGNAEQGPQSSASASV